MTLTLMRVLALWTGCLALMVISVLPLSWVAQTMAATAACLLVTGGWLLAGRRSVRLGGSLKPDEFRALPGSEYRLPVVLVCGEGAAALFEGDADVDADAGLAGQSAVRTTASGCYVWVPSIERLPEVAAALLAVRPQWRAQISVMFVINPAQHAHSAVLAGELRTLTHQLSVVRRRALRLPLWVVSYQASQDARDVGGTGFSREGAGSGTESVWFSGGVRNFVFGHNMSERCMYANQKETCVTRVAQNP